MMLAPVVLMLSLASTQTCNATIPNNTHVWIKADRDVKAVDPKFQRRMLHRLTKRSLIQINSALAQEITGKRLMPSRYYYLVKGQYVGQRDRSISLPPGVSFSLDVDTRGSAYLSSQTLASRDQKNVSDIAVVLSSPTKINHVLSFCGAAE
jgi:hypothetical protein